MAIERINVRVARYSDFKEKPGVYFLYSNSRIVYIGKSVNIKKRLEQHFMWIIGKCNENTLEEEFENRLHFLRNTRPSKIFDNFDVTEFSEPAQISRIIDYVEVVYMDERDITSVETRYIQEYQPPFNSQLNSEYQRQVDIRNNLRALAICSNREDDSELSVYASIHQMDKLLRSNFNKAVSA